MKKLLSTLLIPVIALLLAAPANSQVAEEKDFSVAFDFGGNIFFNEEGYSKYDDMTFNAMSINLMYNFGNNEIGIVFGRSDAAKRINRFSVIYLLFPGDTTAFFYNEKYLEPRTYYWYGLSYKYNFNNIITAGIKIANTGKNDTYHEISVGKDFKVNKEIFLYGNISYSIITNSLFDFKSSSLYQLGFNAGVKFNIF